MCAFRNSQSQTVHTQGIYGRTRGSADAELPLLEVVKFTMVAALLAIFVDAAIGHAMLWGNDPYWTYWVTDTLLMMTVFGLGTAWFGIGLMRGAAITAVHMVLLTVYYWSFSPIGLPSHAEWLDLEHTWITGLPVHFSVYYLGYVVALWIWRRGPATANDHVNTARTALLSIVVSAAVVTAAGVAQWFLLDGFPGMTWFVMRLAVASAFTLGWWGMIGRDKPAALVGGVILGFLLVTYSHYLGPVGLPNPDMRVLAEDPPPAEVHWLSYRQEFLVLLPVTVLISIIAYLVPSRGRWAELHSGRSSVLVALVSIAFLAILGVVVSLYTWPAAKTAVLTADGPAQQGNQRHLAPATATLRMRVEDRNTKRTPLPPHDGVDLEATVTTSDGVKLFVRAKESMVADPRGRFTTWHGVGVDVWHHGRSGIGYAGLPATHSNVAVYALGSVSAGQKVLASGVPVHVLTSSRNGARLELHVGDPGFEIPELPNGYLRVVWPEYQGGIGPAFPYARYSWGVGVLLVLLGFALAGARRAMRRERVTFPQR